MLAQRLWEDRDFAEAWNFGPHDQDAISVGDLAKHMIAKWGKGELKIQPEKNAPHEAQLLRLNTTKARTRLGWRPILDIDQALSWTADWYRKFYDDASSASSTIAEQIELFSEAASV